MASDFHMEFFGPVSNVTVDSNPPGCPQPLISTSGNTAGLDWQVDCVDPGESLTVRVTGAGLECAYWTRFGVPLQPYFGCGTPTPTTTVTATPAPVTPTSSASPTPVQVHDAAVVRMKGPKYVDLSPGVPDSSGTTTVIVGKSFSDHADDVSVDLAFDPPGGFGSNPGGCSVVVPGATPAEQANQVFNWTRIGAGTPFVNLLPGQKVTLSANPQFVCTNPAAVNGLNWTLKAVADVHADDSASCDTLGEVFNGACATAVNDDDTNDANNSMVRGFPIVRAH